MGKDMTGVLLGRVWRGDGVRVSACSVFVGWSVRFRSQFLCRAA